jgi:hypothetical protein
MLHSITQAGLTAPGLTRLGRGLAAIAVVVVLFYAIGGYLGSADMFGNHPRWRGMNRGPADFGLRSETVSFNSKDGIPLKAWWLPTSGTPRGTVVVAHGIDHTRQVMLPRQVFLFAAATTFRRLISAATVRAEGPSSRLDFWRRAISSAHFVISGSVETTNRRGPGGFLRCGSLSDRRRRVSRDSSSN